MFRDSFDLIFSFPFFTKIPRALQVFNATVKMGADGTDDDVTVGICSDSKTDCCERKLNKALTDNWKKNKVRLMIST